ncbi:hypothetical protein LTR56_001469 [Elasticomyces elasticus]|nr:hypothetical protein LTR56_001469 [Elasticomyces elasticus]KAK3668608.1 hypothetical protein LTR22_000495 [Elasticomyces elasticus]KAK4931960.1 hypothetical protein LTR49_001647 [Elasticomyces elasticus]KAK5768508.1 hypothetical protein LTS12_001296 [Elasticomyces elasticus]
MAGREVHVTMGQSKAATESSISDLDMHNRCIVRRIKGVTNQRTHDTVALILEEIKSTAALPGGLSYASTHVMNLVSKFTESVVRNQGSRLSRAECDIYYTPDKALSGVVAATWNKLSDPQCSVRLSSREMLDDLENIYDVLQRRKANNDGVFEESIFNLRACESRRSTYNRVMVAVGHVFPTELVGLIWEDACSEETMGHLRGFIVKYQAEEWTKT